MLYVRCPLACVEVEGAVDASVGGGDVVALKWDDEVAEESL